jgi:hypothetical protein
VGPTGLSSCRKEEWGSILHISCSACAYDDEVQVGSGMAGIGNDTMVCEDCHRVVSVMIEDAGLASGGPEDEVRPMNCCEVCGGRSLTPLDVEGRTESQERAPPLQQCPRCHELGLTAEKLGIWD